MAYTIDLSPHDRPHGIAFLDRRSTVLVTSETSRAVLEVDVRARKVVRAMDTGAEGSHMLAIAADRSRVFTANTRSGSVTAIDLSSGKIAGIVPTGDEPEAIDLSPDGGELWVGHRQSDTIAVLDARTLAKKAELPCARDPIRLKFTPDGARVLVSNHGSADVAVFDAHTRREIVRIALGPSAGGSGAPRLDPELEGLLIDPRGHYAFVAESALRRIATIDLERLAFQGFIETGRGPDGMSWTRIERTSFLGDEPGSNAIR